MANKKATIVLSILLIFAVVIQAYPLDIVNYDGADSYVCNSRAVINRTVHDNTIAVLNSGNKESFLRVPASRLQFFYESSFFTLLHSMQFSIDKGYVFNTREKIKNILYNHFNGTKYKEVTFII